jgi:hypothetical protein
VPSATPTTVPTGPPVVPSATPTTVQITVPPVVTSAGP